MVELHAKSPNAKARIHWDPFQKLISIMPDDPRLFTWVLYSPKKFAHAEISFIIVQVNTKVCPISFVIALSSFV
jgi:hypothetical protein